MTTYPHGSTMVIQWDELTPEQQQRYRDLALLGTLEENYRNSQKLAEQPKPSRKERRKLGKPSHNFNK